MRKQMKFLSGGRVGAALTVSMMLAFSSASWAVSIDEYLRDARQYFDKGEYNAGVIQLKNALQVDPNNAAARFLLADVYIRLGDGAGAEKELLRARKLGLGRESWVALLGKSYLLQAKRAELLAEVQAEDGDSDTLKAEIYAVRGAAYLAERDLLNAEEAFSKGQKFDANNAAVELGLARVDLSRKQFDTGRQRIRRVLKLEPENVEAWALMGEQFRVQGKFSEALEALDKAVELEPQNPASRLVRAENFLSMNDLDRAESDIMGVLKARPNLPYGNYLRAKLLYQQDDAQGAEQALRQVFRVSPTHLPSQLLMGLVQYNLGNMQLAEDSLSRYTATAGVNLPALKLLAATYMRLDLPEKARETLEQGVEEYGEDPQLLALLGSSYLAQGDNGKAVEMLERAVEKDPDQPAFRAQLARAKMGMGDADDAIAQLEEAVSGDQEMVEADIMLVLTHLYKKDYDKAVGAAQNLADRRQNDPVSYNLLGVVQLGQGNLAGARKEFQKALDLKPTFSMAELNLALIDRHEGDLDAAQRKLENILNYKPDHLDALISLSKLSRERGDNAIALRYLERAWAANKGQAKIGLELVNSYLQVNKNLNALNVAREVSAANQKNIPVMRKLGIVLMRNGEYGEAISTLQKVVYLQPDVADTRYLLALAQVRGDRRREAKDSVESVLAIDPDYLPALVMQSKLLLADNQFSRSLVAVKKVQEVAPESAVGYKLEADINRERREFMSAAKLYEKAYGIEPSSELVLLLAESYRNAGQADAAIETLSNWVNENDDDVRVRMVLASLYQGSNDRPKAIAAYTQLMERLPTNVVVLNNLAWLYHEVGDSRSLELAERAVEIAPETPEVIDTLGWILVKSGDAKRGLRYLKQAAISAPHLPTIRYHLAVAYNESGFREQAVDELQSLLGAHDNFEGRDDAVILLRNLSS